jgi:hypothetical protein
MMSTLAAVAAPLSLDIPGSEVAMQIATTLEASQKTARAAGEEAFAAVLRQALALGRKFILIQRNISTTC